MPRKDIGGKMDKEEFIRVMKDIATHSQQPLNMEWLYCTSCRVKFIGERTKDECKVCGIQNFFLLRGGDIGTTMTFQQMEITSDDFEDVTDD